MAAHAGGLIACVPLAPLVHPFTLGHSPRTREIGGQRSEVRDQRPAPARVRVARPDKGVANVAHARHAQETHAETRFLQETGFLAACLARWRDVFGDRCYALAELHRSPDDAAQFRQMRRMADAARVPVAAANDVHYHVPARRFLQDVVTAVRHGCTVAELGERMFPNGERYLKSPQGMLDLFAADPAAIARTVEVADRCTFSLDELRYEYPRELSPAGTTPLEYLTRLTWDGAARRYPDGVPEKVRTLIEHELRLIAELQYEAYFLTVWDLVRFARSRDILCQGRGSAANSAVCYCLEVTSVNPDCIDVLFERFISKERGEAPDIDVDFEHERREEVIQYVYEKYGRERAGMAATVITYRPRSALRDVGKALGLSLDCVDVAAKSVEPATGEDKFAGRVREAGLDPASRIGRQFVGLTQEILGFPRHLSQHVGGLVLTEGPLCELVPIENAAMPGRTVIQWDKDDLDTLGLLKVDCLSLGMLTAIRKCFDLIALHHGARHDLAGIPPDDRPTYEMIQRADTLGVFQIESRAQMSMLPRLKPDCFYDLVIEVPSCARADPGGHGASVSPPAARGRAGGVSRRADPRRAGEDARRPHLPGTGHAVGGGGGGLHAGRSRSTPPRNGRLAPTRRAGRL